MVISFLCPVSCAVLSAHSRRGLGHSSHHCARWRATIRRIPRSAARVMDIPPGRGHRMGAMLYAPCRHRSSVNTTNPRSATARLPAHKMPGPPLTPSDFQQTCGFCGSVFRVAITWPTVFSYTQHQDEVYACPECHQPSKIKSSSPPLIMLLVTRTDGRTMLHPLS
jgi:hypothetical protein